MNINMDWEQDEFTVYALNCDGVNDFSFTVQGNGRNGHDPKKLQEVVNLAKHAPEMYFMLKGIMETIPTVLMREGLYDDLEELLFSDLAGAVHSSLSAEDLFLESLIKEKTDDIS